MNATDFAKLLQKPFLLAQYNTKELESLVLLYPYCQNLRILLLKKYQQENPSVFDKRLALESTYALNRAALYQFLQFPIAIWEETPAPILPTEEPIVTEVAPCGVSENPPRLTRQELLESAAILEKKTTDESPNIILGRSIALEMASDKTKKKRFKLPRIPVFEDKNALDFFEDTAQLEPATTITQTTATDDVFSLTDAFLKGLSERLKNAENQGLTNNTHTDETDSIGDKSLEEDDEIASETLAHLLTQQGQIARAKRMYEVLSTQFPEKADFFKQKIALLTKKNS